MFTYSIKIEPQEEGGFVISVPTLPGCFSEGESLEAATNNIQDAIEGYLHTLWKNKLEIPMELKFQQVQIDPQKFAHA